MIGVISGKVLFSDGNEIIIFTNTGIGYQSYCRYIMPEGESATLYISHIIRDTSEDLYCFRTLREKKLFELLTTVKGVGPKSAFNLVSNVSTDEIIMAIQSDEKKVLIKVPGLGAKAASQIILDLQSKIRKVKMFSNKYLKPIELSIAPPTNRLDKAVSSNLAVEDQRPEIIEPSITQNILEDTISACKNLGFQSEHIIPLAQKILRENQIKKTEQLVHLVLKEI